MAHACLKRYVYRVDRTSYRLYESSFSRVGNKIIRFFERSSGNAFPLGDNREMEKFDERGTKMLSLRIRIEQRSRTNILINRGHDETSVRFYAAVTFLLDRFTWCLGRDEINFACATGRRGEPAEGRTDGGGARGIAVYGIIRCTREGELVSHAYSRSFPLFSPRLSFSSFFFIPRIFSARLLARDPARVLQRRARVRERRPRRPVSGTHGRRSI